MKTYEFEAWNQIAYEVEDFDNFIVEAENIRDALNAIMPRRYFMIKAFIVLQEDSYFVREFNIVRGQRGKRVDYKSEWKIKHNHLKN